MLTSKQRGFLAGLGSIAQPTVMVGKEGASTAVEKALAAELKCRELVKLRFINSKDDRDVLARQLAERSGSDLVRLIGNVAIYFKPSADPANRRIILPV